MFIIQGVNCIFSVKEKTKGKRHQCEQSHDTLHQRDVGQQNKASSQNRTFEKCAVLHFNTFNKCEVIFQTKETTTGSKVIY